MEGRTLIHGTLPATARGPINIFFIAGKTFLKIPKNSMHFFAEAGTKKQRYALAKPLAFEDWQDNF